jgi:hypothetical protein
VCVCVCVCVLLQQWSRVLLIMGPILDDYCYSILQYALQKLPYAGITITKAYRPTSTYPSKLELDDWMQTIVTTTRSALNSFLPLLIRLHSSLEKFVDVFLYLCLLRVTFVGFWALIIRSETACTRCGQLTSLIVAKWRAADDTKKPKAQMPVKKNARVQQPSATVN